MFLAMAYCLAVTTALMVLALLWLGREHRRGEAWAELASTVAAQNSKLGQAPQTVIGRSPR